VFAQARDRTYLGISTWPVPCGRCWTLANETETETVATLREQA